MTSILEETKEVLAELKVANAERLALIEREEKLHAEQLISGKAEAGITPPPIDHELEIRNKAKSYFSGTCIGEMIK